ncbi:MAG TPA: cell division protein ZapB [Thermodesulfobacteriota bacterium]|nr:cell division protein ZapB [Thermodesulfobacteriota bacterium]
MLKRLEDGVGQLLDRYDLLQAEVRGLKEALGSKEREIRDLKERIKKLDSEKGLVREKVDSLLTRLDGLVQGA